MSLPLGSQDHVYPSNYEILLVDDQSAVMQNAILYHDDDSNTFVFVQPGPGPEVTLGVFPGNQLKAIFRLNAAA